MNKKLIESIVKGIGIASAGGGIAIGAGSINMINVDFVSTAAVVVFSILFNTLYQFLKSKYLPIENEK